MLDITLIDNLCSNSDLDRLNSSTIMAQVVNDLAVRDLIARIPRKGPPSPSRISLVEKDFSVVRAFTHCFDDAKGVLWKGKFFWDDPIDSAFSDSVLMGVFSGKVRDTVMQSCLSKKIVSRIPRGSAAMIRLLIDHLPVNNRVIWAVIFQEEE